MAREKDHRLAFHCDTHQIAGQVNLKISPRKRLQRLLAFGNRYLPICRYSDSNQNRIRAIRDRPDGDERKAPVN